MRSWTHFPSRPAITDELSTSLPRPFSSVHSRETKVGCGPRQRRLVVRLLWLTSALVTLLLLPLSVQARAERWLERGLDQVRPFVATLGATADRPISTLKLNGIALHFLSTRSELPPALFLERSRKLCASPLELFPLALRANQARRGLLVCFESGGTHSPSLSSRLEELLRSGDWAALGVLRAVFAEPSPSGGTVALTLTVPSLPLFSLFPAEGDSPGFDFPHLPRPPGRRLLSLTRIVPSSGYEEPVLTLYETPQPETAPLHSLRQRLRETNWKIRSSSPEHGLPHAAQTLLLQNQSETLLVLAQSTDAHTLSLVSRLPQ